MNQAPDPGDGPDFESLLRERLRQARAGAADVEASIAGLGALWDPNNDDEHDPDGSPVSAEWSRLAGMQLKSRATEAEIEAALDRIERGTYGICVGCGQPIPPARLAIRPMAVRCVPCAQSS